MSTVGEIVREERKKRSWSVQMVADRVGAHVQLIYKIEYGKVVDSKYLPDLERLFSLATGTLTSIAARGQTPNGRRNHA